jgi:NAD(P)-dependent dehydrogenase (short-subunit alcohol dehydrogenase family)
MRRLEGRVAIVTGAGGGIGRATALRLASEGASVACVDIAAANAEATAAAVVAAGGTAAALAIDVSTRAGNEAMVADTVAAFGAIDVLHANAAVQRMGQLDQSSDDDWDALYRTNLLGVGLGITAALPHFRARGGGSVIMTASLLGIVGDPDMPAYGAMKGGLRAMCRSLAAAHGPENIRFTTICPGDVQTPMLDEFFDHQPDPDDARARVLQHYPLRRFAQPEDIANLVAFLASDDAAYLTGIDIPIDGGLLAQIY